ncbi:MAG TPA: RluA family pseudouridine synthase [Candidatus Angelobacter sp.]|jgi:23S rRNA pseudouridine1911/1915/1917 synthase|nr:RluA family pseudouridine synthase [Candidatus Angelobacter sp.]
MYEHIKFIVEKEHGKVRVDKFLTNFMKNISRRRIQNSAIWINEKPVKPSFLVKCSDRVSVLMNSLINQEIKSEDVPLNLIYEDKEIIVVNKPPGMVVHPGIGNSKGTLVNALKSHLNKDTYRFGLAHRIDKDTSGLLVVAKNNHSLEQLMKQFFFHKIQREYLAIVCGNLNQEKGIIAANIGRNPNYPKNMMVFTDGSRGKNAVTHYKVLENFRYVTFISCHLETGRTHQIRTHLKFLGHPIFNDPRYGGDKIFNKIAKQQKFFLEKCFELCKRQALHANYLGFTHPKSGKYLHFECDLSKDFLHLLNKCRGL